MTRKPTTSATTPTLTIPASKNAVVAVGEREVKLTNLDKPFWPELGLTKRDLLRYYADVAPVLLPHLVDRAMVMKRYPDGADGESFFMKRAPTPRPEWIETCAIAHDSGNVIDFPMIQDLASLLWVVNLGCIDLNPWYARCDDVDRPDYLHFDLDPVPEATLRQRRRDGALVRDGCKAGHDADRQDHRLARHARLRADRARADAEGGLDASPSASRSSSPRCGPTLITAEYRVAKRPAGRVLVDYNQNAWGRTLASVYSPRPRPRATVSAPVDLGRARGRRADRGLRPAQRAGADRRGRRPVGAAARGAGRFDLAPLLRSIR